MPLPSTYIPIATNTLTATATNIAFSNIPQAYTDLVLTINAKGSAGSDIYSRLNGDSGTNYSSTYLNGTGSSSASGRLSSQAYFLLDSYGYVETTDGQMLIAHFMSYSNTSTNKAVLTRASNATNGTTALAGLWRSTAAITSITIYCGVSGATFSAGSSFTLYGIKAA